MDFMSLVVPGATLAFGAVLAGVSGIGVLKVLPYAAAWGVRLVLRHVTHIDERPHGQPSFDTYVRMRRAQDGY